MRPVSSSPEADQHTLHRQTGLHKFSLPILGGALPHSWRSFRGRARRSRASSVLAVVDCADDLVGRDALQ